MEQTIGQTEVLGRKIHEARGGEGQPVLYLHSAMGEAIWLPHLVSLASRYAMHVPAHPGFLQSEGIDEIRDMEDLVYHYLSYMDAKGWESVPVIGVSLGGWLAAEIAARYPDRVSKLVLVAAVGIWIREQPIHDIFAIDTRFPERFKAALFHDVECPAAQALPTPGSMDLPDDVVLEMLRAFAATAKIGWNPLLHDPRLELLLHRITAPTLCLWGANDRVVPVAYGEKFARLIPNAKLEVIPECGHAIPFEKEEEFRKAVTTFLG